MLAEIRLLPALYRGADAAVGGFAREVVENFQRLRRLPSVNPPANIGGTAAIGTVYERYAREDHVHALTSSAPATGDIVKWNGSAWVPLTPVSITIYQYRWDSSTGQLQERSKSITALADGSWGSWADIGTYYNCT